MSSKHALILIGSLLGAGATVAAELNWYTVDGGGAYCAGGPFELAGTIGQPDAGVMTGGNFTLTGGFWGVTPAGPSAPGDCDGDGDVDLIDFGDFELCLSGPATLSPLGCACADGDGDGDTDLDDFAEFQRLYAE